MSVLLHGLQKARDGGLEPLERAKATGSNHFKVDQPGEGCLVAGRFVANSFNHGIQPALGIPWTCFKIPLKETLPFGIGVDATPVRAKNLGQRGTCSPRSAMIQIPCLPNTTATENVRPRSRLEWLRGPVPRRDPRRKTLCLQASRCRHRESAATPAALGRQRLRLAPEQTASSLGNPSSRACRPNRRERGIRRSVKGVTYHRPFPSRKSFHKHWRLPRPRPPLRRKG